MRQEEARRRRLDGDAVRVHVDRGELVAERLEHRADALGEQVDRPAIRVALGALDLELAERHPVAEFGLDPAGPIGALLPELEREGLPVRLLDGKDAVRACGAFVAGVSDKTLSHRGEPELLTAVGGASRRAVGDGWKWSRKDSSVDISPLVAATYAHWLWLSREGAPISPEIYFV